jgi:hypothetical protein
MSMLIAEKNLVYISTRDVCVTLCATTLRRWGGGGEGGGMLL